MHDQPEPTEQEKADAPERLDEEEAQRGAAWEQRQEDEQEE